ncbi:High-affinity glucose transporter [Colletotrichum sp. SAR 10_70]|nr:High-affinity glucose transporter [Colletotrichum sp. SAR 10_70]KAI8223180.1 High-affinity glucose transporter [Colletotrichum sp. SAR 10_86]KAJ5007756.1 High-affinity glucose transporter [Colletotrichum sp. SAR 10_66]
MSDLEKTQSRSGAHSQVEDVNANILAQADAPINYDVDGIKGIVRSPYVLGAALLASFGGFSFGYDQGVISIILVMPQFHDQFPETSPDHPRYGFNTGFMTGMLEFGAFIGCLFLPYLADKISRKWALTIATFFFCVGAIIQTAAHYYGTLVAGRTIGGIGVGTLAMGAPLYISEIAPPNLRGSLLVLESISIVIGAIVAYWITFGTRSISGEWAFRLPFALQMAPALMVGLGIHFFPFSPRWLAMVGRDEDSLGALTKLRRVPVSDELVQTEWKGILSEVRFQQAMVARDHPSTNAFTAELAQWADLFRPRYLKRTTIALAIPFFQQFSGINAFVYYAPTFFAALGQKGDMPLILSGMVNICQLIAGIPTFLFLDQVGRRKLAIGGGFAMAVPHLIMAGVVGKFNSSWDEHPAMGWLGVALIYIYVLCYATSYGPLAWTLPAEIFPNSKRAKGVGAATAMIWLANFIIGVCVPEMLIKIGWGTYLFFGCFCVAAGVFSFFMVPETAHKSLEQISALFGDHSVAEEQDIRRRIVEEIWTDPKYQVSSMPKTPQMRRRNTMLWLQEVRVSLPHLTGSDSETYVSAVQAVFHAQQEDTIGLFSIIYHPPRGADIYAPSMPSLRHSATLIALRQEIWSVLLYRRPFRLPLYGAEDCSQFEPDMVADDFDWANRILVWCAYVLKFCFGTSSDNTIDSEDPKSRVEQWNALKAFEHNWDEHLPPHYKPLAYQERNPEKGDYFPIIWHANDCQVLALQHIELTRIMLAVHSVKNQRLGIGAQAANQAFEELLRDATRKICGLALSNHRDQPAMVTAGVGISLCGEYFHDEGEQQAIVEFMANLESLHAWPTSSVVDALRTAWGTK